MFLKKTVKLGIVSFLSIVTLAACGNDDGMEEEDATMDTTLDEGMTDTSEMETEDGY